MVKVGLLQTPSGLAQMAQSPWLSKIRLFKWVFQTLDAGIKDTTKGTCELLVLPEVWNGPYNVKCFRPFAECIPPLKSVPTSIMNVTAAKIKELLMSNDSAENTLNRFQKLFKFEIESEVSVGSKSYVSTTVLSAIAQSFNVYVIGGSIVELDAQGDCYNTLSLYNPEGTLLYTYSKSHLFDIDIPNRIKFKESDAFKPGSQLDVVELPWGLFGVALCFDVRFPEVSSILRDKGAKYLVFPSNFNYTTGPLHYELLLRARAVDTQCFVIGASAAPPAQPKDLPPVDLSLEFPAHGHTTVVDPWGKVLLDAGIEAGYYTMTLDEEQISNTRDAIPIYKLKRRDMYQLTYSPKKNM